MTYQDCPRCEYPLKTETWNFQGGDMRKIEVFLCVRCNWSGIKNILEDVIEDLSPNEFIEERQWVNKMASQLLTSQKIKIRFVKKLTNNRIWGDTRFWLPTDDIIDMSFPKKTLERPKYFRKVVFPHELGHASKRVRSHPNYNPHSKEFTLKCSRCGESHPGEGHDKVWHDEFDRLKEELEK